MIGILRKLDFLRSFFGTDESAARAKERLRIVLIQDQSSISSELLNVLRNEMVGVVSRYVEIDLSHLEMGIERRGGAIALAASIPIVRIRREGRVLVPAENGADAESTGRKPGVAPPETSTRLVAGSAGEGRESAVAVALPPEPPAARQKGDRRQRRGRRH